MAYGTIAADVITGTNGNSFSPESSVFRNRIINGAMVIDQRNAGASVSITNASPYTLDRWFGFASQSSKFTVQQNAGSVTPPAGFTNYLGVTSSSAYSVGASEQFLVQQRIEGFNCADLAWGTANARTVTLSFWVRSSLTGTFGGALFNDSGARSYPFTYTISSANTWEQKSITIVGDTTGTWLTTNGAGICVNFSMGIGSSLSGTAGAWAGSYLPSATGATSVVGTNGATWYITGVQLEVGSQATSFDYRQYGTELALCQRYYWELVRGDSIYFTNAWQFSTNQCYAVIQFPVTMRANPTLFSNSGSTYYIFYRGSSSDSFDSFTLGFASKQSCSIANTTDISGTSGEAGGIISNGSNAMVAFGAEL
jgi:hypothetical protein